MEKKEKIKRAQELVKEYYKTYGEEGPPRGEFLAFDTEGDLHKILAPFANEETEQDLAISNITIYNPTKPIIRQGKRYLAGRVEPLDSEESKIMFFEDIDNKWRLVSEAPILGLQDPFFIDNIQGYHIIGGVKTFKKENDEISWKTEFYRYKTSILELINLEGKLVEPFAVGPDGMKDIRLIELSSKKIAVFTRPQGGRAGLGKIGYIEIEKLDELESKIPEAQIIENQFHSDEWGGANELHLLKNDNIGVLGHIAHSDGEIKHYYAMAFIFNPKTKRHSHMEILTTADEFPSFKPKKNDLGKIIFSGGLYRNPDGTADLYVGIGDVHSGKIKIRDPFVKHEE